MMPSLLVISLAIVSCTARVDFAYSTMYDIYDFVGQSEVPISRCDKGCVIFASTMGDRFNSTSGNDPFAENLIIRNGRQTLNNIADLSRSWDKSFAKKPLTISGPASISVQNRNALTDQLRSVVLYIVDTTRADVLAPTNLVRAYVYDAFNIKGMDVNSNMIITVMSADPFSLSAAKTDWESNGVLARLVGFDNIHNKNGDSCQMAYNLPSVSPFPGYRMNVNGPIITVLHSDYNYVTIDAKRGMENPADLAEGGFVTSAGYNGCMKSRSTGGVQSFRSPIYQKSSTFLMASGKDNYDVSFDAYPNMDALHKVSVEDVTDGLKTTITGYNPQKFYFNKSKYIKVTFDDLTGDQGFLLTYNSNDLNMKKIAAITIGGSSVTNIADSVNGEANNKH